MTGREFFKLATRRGIPISCIAARLNCKLATLRTIQYMESVPKPYIIKFISAFQDLLSDQEIELLTQA